MNVLHDLKGIALCALVWPSRGCDSPAHAGTGRALWSILNKTDQRKLLTSLWITALLREDWFFSLGVSKIFLPGNVWGWEFSINCWPPGSFWIDCDYCNQPSYLSSDQGPVSPAGYALTQGTLYPGKSFQALSCCAQSLFCSSPSLIFDCLIITLWFFVHVLKSFTWWLHSIFFPHHNPLLQIPKLA